MYKSFTIQIYILLHIFLQALAENKTQEIEALEKEKSNLFKQINNAIDESVNALIKNNETEALLGVNYMQQLKEQLKEINGTDFNNTDGRRSHKLSLNMVDIAKVFQKGKYSKKKLEREEHKIIMQQKIDEWILQRELEKQRIREYKESLMRKITVEKCPRFGISDSKKEIKRRHQQSKKKGKRRDGATGGGSKEENLKQDESEKKKEKSEKRKKVGPKYPCCRKCCKKSYMGCL